MQASGVRVVRVEEEDVPGRDERDDGVRLGGVEEEHVWADGRRAGLRDAEGDRGREVDPLRLSTGRVPPFEVAAVVDVDRPAARRSVGVRLVDRPDLVARAVAGARDADDAQRQETQRDDGDQDRPQVTVHRSLLVRWLATDHRGGR